jgi:excinuclease ABC subunit B
LLGVTGSGKTFTMARVIAELGRPTLIMAPNKTLAAQLYQEFKAFFPQNAVEYFVSYYDYYQPEAYVAASDTYIEKESTINKDLEKLRLSATRSLIERRDVVIVASVSCIYGLGSPEFFGGMSLSVRLGQTLDRQGFLRDLVGIQYSRNQSAFYPGSFRAHGDTIEIFPAYEDTALRLELFDDEVDGLCRFDPLTGKTIAKMEEVAIFPSSHFVTPSDRLQAALRQIRLELDETLRRLHAENRLLEAQRLSQRTQFDLELLGETGFCHGIENYSRHLDGRPEGSPPSTLMDYFPQDFLLFVDESHVTIPQIGGMYKGDRSRKENLVRYGFRLPSALDNRPLTFEEFKGRCGQVVYVSATPGDYELRLRDGVLAEQIIRPTGLMDPPIDVRPSEGQIDVLLEEIEKRRERGERTLITTLTKRMAEDLSEYLRSHGVKVAYLHSEIDTLERLEILRRLRMGEHDAVVGVNLLREGLDLPEVSLVGILDADKEGYLRSTRSLIQTVGRAARNVHGRVLLFCSRISQAMKETIEETDRRRARQAAYNQAMGITPQSVVRSLADPMGQFYEKDYLTPRQDAERPVLRTRQEAQSAIEVLEKHMRAHAEALQFEEAARVRDEIRRIRLMVETD